MKLINRQAVYKPKTLFEAPLPLLHHQCFFPFNNTLIQIMDEFIICLLLQYQSLLNNASLSLRQPDLNVLAAYYTLYAELYSKEAAKAFMYFIDIQTGTFKIYIQMKKVH